ARSRVRVGWRTATENTGPGLLGGGRAGGVLVTFPSPIPPVPAPARVAPSGLKATEETGPKFVFSRPPLIVSSGRFHSWMVPSAPPLARVSPCGLNATESTFPLWLLSWLRIRWPVFTSHSPTVPSVLALARVLPSGLNPAAVKLMGQVRGVIRYRAAAASIA